MHNIHFFDRLIEFYSSILKSPYVIYSIKKVGANITIAKSGHGNKIYPILGFIPRSICYITKARAANNIRIISKIKSLLEDRDPYNTILQLNIINNKCNVIISDYSLNNKSNFTFRFSSINIGF